MTKLTNWMREGITKKVMIHRFREQADALVTDYAVLAADVYVDIYSEIERKRMDALPEGWLPTSEGVYVQFGEGGRNYHRLNFDGDLYSAGSRYASPRKDRMKRRVLAKHDGSRCMKVYDDQHELARRASDLRDRESEISKAADAAQRQIEAALRSASTIKRLVEMWPEIEPFAAEYVDRPAPVPALPTEQLNRLLDLPVSEAA